MIIIIHHPFSHYYLANHHTFVIIISLFTSLHRKSSFNQITISLPLSKNSLYWHLPVSDAHRDTKCLFEDMTSDWKETKLREGTCAIMMYLQDVRSTRRFRAVVTLARWSTRDVASARTQSVPDSFSTGYRTNIWRSCHS